MAHIHGLARHLKPIVGLILLLGCGLTTTKCGDDQNGNSSSAAKDHGISVTYDDNGGQIRTTYAHGVKHGEFDWYRPDGTVYMQGNYAHGKKEGWWDYDDTRVKYTCYYKNGKKSGEERWWDRDGSSWALRESRFYIEGKRKASGVWNCSKTTSECVPWDGTWWIAKTDIATGEGAVFRRIYESGKLVSEIEIEEMHSAYHHLF